MNCALLRALIANARPYLTPSRLSPHAAWKGDSGRETALSYIDHPGGIPPGKGTLTPLQCRFRLSSRVQTEKVASRPARTAAVVVSIGLMILSLILINRSVFSRRRHRRRGCESGISPA